jgi:hypothetical protein
MLDTAENLRFEVDLLYITTPHGLTHKSIEKIVFLKALKSEITKLD